MAARKKVAKRWSVKSALLWVALVAVLVAAGFAALEPATRTIYHQLYPRSYRSYVEQYSREYDVDENLVYAVAKVESNFDPNAVSSADARGLMQMTEDAFEWVQYRMGDQSGVTCLDSANNARNLSGKMEPMSIGCLKSFPWKSPRCSGWSPENGCQI